VGSVSVLAVSDDDELNESTGRTRASAPRHSRPTVADEGLEAPGDVLGTYELVKLLGEGSMGRVFLARHLTLGRQVAIKILRPEQYRNAELVQRFFQEAKTVNQINHEHIVEVIDFAQELGPDGPISVYFVMELLTGTSLAGLIASTSVGLQRSLGIVGQLCEALAAAHKLGVVHRDLKPDNVFITERAGRADYVKVLDFGVAKLTSVTKEKSLVATREGAIVGTPICMAPEQAAGLEVDHRADIWATGVMLYELLSGRLPFEASNFALLAAQIIAQPPPPMPPKTPSGERIPAKLKALVLRCLEKDAGRRPQTMNELKDALAAFVGQGAAGAKNEGRWKLLAAGLAVTLAAAGAIQMFGARRTEAPVAVLIPPSPPPVIAAPVVVAEPVVAPPPAQPAPVAAVVKPSQKPVVAAAERAPGPLRVEELTATFSRSTSKLLKCFDLHRAQLTDRQGSVTITLSIEPGGAVTATKVSTPEGSPLSACIVNGTKGIRFPKHSGPPVTVNVPFAYRVED
jgi:tRNA A-37 threonylcarbamoyl transferase component Bud32